MCYLNKERFIQRSSGLEVSDSRLSCRTEILGGFGSFATSRDHEGLFIGKGTVGSKDLGKRRLGLRSGEMRSAKLLSLVFGGLLIKTEIQDVASVGRRNSFCLALLALLFRSFRDDGGEVGGCVAESSFSSGGFKVIASTLASFLRVWLGFQRF